MVTPLGPIAAETGSLAGARVLVTGGCGFIGANLVARLRDDGCRVTVVDNLSRGRRENIPFEDVPIVVGDVRDGGLLRSLAAEADSVVHLAAQTYVVTSIADPAGDLDTNVRGTLNLLEACASTGVRRFVFSSSGAAAGNASTAPGSAPMPVSPYGASKLAGEAYCSAFRQTFNVPTVVLRFTNVYGPMSEHKTSIVAKFMQLVSRGEGVTIYGDGQQTRDFIFVGDVVEAIVRSLTRDVVGEVLDVGSGTQTCILDLVNEIGAVMNRPVKVSFEPRRPGEVLHTRVAPDRTWQRFGCAPRTSLREGLVNTYRYFDSLRAAKEVS